MKVSVVVPTFNRGRALEETLERLLATEMDKGDDLEIIVVDYGSVAPAREAMSCKRFNLLQHPNLRWLRQRNGGPASARNAGFHSASGDIVLFVDDDILAPRSLVRAHVAAHRARPGTVIFGLCPFAPGRETPFRSLLEQHMVGHATLSGELVPMRIVASGQISIERNMFAPGEDVYSSQLVTPGAEEYELAFRLRERGVPILAAPGIVAWHDQRIDISSYCRAQYKHGVGCGEAASKSPPLLGDAELANIIQVNRPGRSDANLVGVCNRAQKWLVSTRLTQSVLLCLARALERIPVPTRFRYAAFRAAISAHFVAGVRDGLSVFSSTRSLRRGASALDAIGRSAWVSAFRSSLGGQGRTR